MLHGAYRWINRALFTVTVNSAKNNQNLRFHPERTPSAKRQRLKKLRREDLTCKNNHTRPSIRIRARSAGTAASKTDTSTNPLASSHPKHRGAEQCNTRQRAEHSLPFEDHLVALSGLDAVENHLIVGIAGLQDFPLRRCERVLIARKASTLAQVQVEASVRAGIAILGE